MRKTRRRPYSEQRPRDLGGGVSSVPVPIPGNPLGYTLVYAVDSPRGPVLVDAGWHHPDAWEALRGGLGALGIDVTTVQGVVVTHFHPDHAGLAGRVREVSGAWIAMHEADAALVRLMRGFADGDHRGFQADMLRRAGAGPGDMVAVSADRPRAPTQPDRELGDGDLIDLPGRELRAVHTPGHTPGHICLHLVDAGRLFTGDHVLPDITPHVGVYPYDRDDVDPLGDFLDSLDRVGELGPLDGLPAHEWTFPDVAARAAEIRRHHEEKLVRLAALLAERAEPLTIWEVAAMMTWNRPWADLSPVPRSMAAGEAAAHLRALEASGRIRRVSGLDTVRFQALES
ncbi:MBL fold metallo-hydrolase [Nonomuraea lactucae]|uniref:MBL fold metallo-hydrolase n=1 Tax=Nonomuraea lactucae TaxID=2249762 RepID=UPI000DE1A8DE|nr:MBL fold metallo-hydrolase [Nonomuraea lactucae]